MRTLLACTAALALAACGGERTTEFETDQGEGSYTVDGSTGQASGSIETEDGTVEFRSGPGTAVDLPAGFTVYPGARVVTNTAVGRGDGKGAMVVMQSDDAPDRMVSFYRKQAEAAGVSIEMELKTAQGTMIGGKSDDGTSFSLNANSQDGKTNAQLTVSSGLQE